MVSQETTNLTKKEMPDMQKKPYRVFIEIYEVLSGPHFSHQDTGWDPKRQPKGSKKEMSGM
jgi:hypothetical protein